VILLSLYLFLTRPVSGIGETAEQTATSTDSISLTEKVEAEYWVKELKEVKVYEVKQDRDIQIIEYINKLWGKDADLMLAIFRCESGLKDIQSYAYYPNGQREQSWGVAQIHLKAHWDRVDGNTYQEKVDNLLNWQYNLDFAHKLYLESGITPWTCRKYI